MASAANALQAAIYQALVADASLTALMGADSIFDRRISGKPMPYLVLSEIITSDIGPEAEEHIFTIEAWSDAEGRKEAQEMASRVRELLHDAELLLSGVALVDLMHRSTVVKRQPKTRAHQAIMTFRAVTE